MAATSLRGQGIAVDRCKVLLVVCNEKEWASCLVKMEYCIKDLQSFGRLCRCPGQRGVKDKQASDTLALLSCPAGIIEGKKFFIA
jgi:hypothetical protein